jgi:cystine transport system substrate-binding protein
MLSELIDYEGFDLMIRMKLFAVTVTTLAALSLAACGGSSSGTAATSKGTLKIGTEGTYSPFTFHDKASNKLTGYDVEVAEAIGAKLGRKVEFSETTFDSIFAGLEAKRYDVVANQITVTPERQAKYSFSQPYTVSTGVIVTRADDTSVTTVADIRGKTSAQSSTSSFAKDATAAGAKVEAVEGFTQAVTLLKQKRVDLTINDQLAVLDYLKTTGDTQVKIAATIGDPAGQAFAFRKGSELAPQFDQALKELRADGTLKTISQKWFGQDVSGPAAG